jgi:hypothetical protein
VPSHLVTPAVLRLPATPTIKSHSPNCAYGRFIACLRWEFGFVCPFCHRHECDLVGGLGVAKLRQISVEHHVSQMEGKTVSGYSPDNYDNCAFACFQCNSNRSSKPRINATSGATLLNPRCDAWGAHFQLLADHLEPNAGDNDANWTLDAYRLNRSAKVAGRQLRRESVTAAFERLSKIASEKAELVREAARTAGGRRRGCLRFIGLLDDLAHRALGELSAYLLVPLDAPTTCQCGATQQLPGWILTQGIPVEFPNSVIDDRRRRNETVA